MDKRLPVDKTWTLFLDRDGVINRRIVDDYVKHPDEFHFLDNVPPAVALLSSVFGRIIVVTNQQGIGKGLYTHDDLQRVHDKMLASLEQAGGYIDAVYYAPQLASEQSLMRKPGIGMASAAKEKFPAIDFARSVMVGDTKSDMQFARNAGMIAVLCGSDDQKIDADLRFASLAEFASYIAAPIT